MSTIKAVESTTPVAASYPELLADTGTKGMVSFSYPEIKPVGSITVKPGPGVYFNEAYPWNWVMHANDTSYIDFKMNFDKTDLQKNWFFNVKQLSSIWGPNGPAYSPIAIQVNGETIVDHFQPQRDAWRIDHFELPADLLKEGNNTIRIQLQNALTNYWIEHANITADHPTDLWIMPDPGAV
jgi:hypothetical protein